MRKKDRIKELRLVRDDARAALKDVESLPQIADCIRGIILDCQRELLSLDGPTDEGAKS